MNKQDIFKKIDANNARLREIASLMEAEKRDATDAEAQELSVLRRENNCMRLRLEAGDDAKRETAQSFDVYAREVIDSQKGVTLTMKRTAETANLSTKLYPSNKASVAGVTFGDVITPLNEGLIYGKLGINLPTGLTGDFVWPTLSFGDATLGGEGVITSESALTISSLKAHPERVSIVVPLTYETINGAGFDIESTVKAGILDKLQKMINAIIFSPSAVNGATALAGPFVGATEEHLQTAAGAIDYKAILGLKAAVLGAGVEGMNLAYIMTEATKAILEATPVDSGSGRMIVEDGKIAGIPVFCTHFIGANKVAVGDFAYQPAGIFGDITLGIDPYSAMDAGIVKFILNADFATKCLRPEAFAIGDITSAQS